MNMESLKLELLRCLERAEEADRDDVRRQWLSAAETWQSAIETRARIQHLTLEWATVKSVAIGGRGGSSRSTRNVNSRSEKS
jgi:hypothetical protein